MKLYNTLTKKLESLPDEKTELIKLYTCGPTVYHYAHIGNLRNVIFNDTLRRALEISGYKVNHVMNITDVGHLASDADTGDDKLEKGAKREGKTVWEVADYYIDAFERHTKALNILPPTKTVRATDAIKSQQELIKTLLDKVFAYQTKQAIYFDVSKLDDYGKLSGQKLSDKEIGVRSEVVTDPDKHHPQDFALWFFTVGHFKDHQMRWDFESYGEGFPGWHLECSAIIHQELGETIDIHTGGVDHIGTHHTNEIAQSEAAFGKPLSKIWMHHEFLHSGGGKMSKSGGDTITLDNIIKKGYDPLALRLLYLQSHYRSHAEFSWESLDAAANRLKKWQALADLRWQPAEIPNQDIDLNGKENIITTNLSEDLNTPQAIVAMDRLTDEVEYIPKDNLNTFNKYLLKADQAFGLRLSETIDISIEQKHMITERQKVRQEKNWSKSDEFRDKLKDQKIGLKDTDQGAIWYRI